MYALVYICGDIVSKHRTPEALGRAQRKILNRDWNTGQTLQPKRVTSAGLVDLETDKAEWFQYRWAVNGISES